MTGNLLAIFVSLAVVGAYAGAARSEVEIEAGGTATFGWSPATGPVDHYQVEVATEAEPPFTWNNYRTTGSDEPSISIGSDSFSAGLPGVAHWTFNENSGVSASDATGNGHDGLLTGTQWVSDTPTGTGSALRFSGASSSVQIGSFDVTGDKLSIAMWFKADDFSSDARLISKATSTATQDHYWMLSTFNSGGSIKLRFRLKTDGSTTTLVATSGTLTPGVWTHAAVVYDGASMRIYKDGVQVAFTQKTGMLSTNGSVNVAIGNQPTGAGETSFDGSIDDVRMYDQALTQTQVAALAGYTVSDSSYVTVRTTAYDSIGNASPPSPVSPTVHFVPATSWLYAVPNDFDGDSVPDVIEHDAQTGVVVLEESSTGAQQEINTLTEMVGDWEIAARGDFDGDAREDLFWRNPITGENRMWLEIGANVIEEDFASVGLKNIPTEWKLLESGDFDGDGFFDLIWLNEIDLTTKVWFMNGAMVELGDFPRLRSASWVLEVSADFDANGSFDLLWRHIERGRTAVWFVDNGAVEFASMPAMEVGSEVAAAIDLNGDEGTDLIWQRPDGSCQVWLMPDGEQFEASTCPAQ